MSKRKSYRQRRTPMFDRVEMHVTFPNEWSEEEVSGLMTVLEVALPGADLYYAIGGNTVVEFDWGWMDDLPQFLDKPTHPESMAHGVWFVSWFVSDEDMQSRINAAMLKHFGPDFFRHGPLIAPNLN